MYKIGEFSKITKLTVKTLRYYDEENILTPSYRNEENGYRFYEEKDFKKAELISLLRNLNFSIAEIKEVISNCEDFSDLSYFLEEKKKVIENKIEEEKLLLKKLNLYINLNHMEGECMNYKIEVKDIKAVTVASMRYKGKYSDVGKYIGKIYSAIKGKADGAPFNCYYDGEYMEEADIEVCVPTSKMISHPEIAIRQLPQIKALCTTHIGPYENLNMAYKALFDYAEEHNIKCTIPAREMYLKGPGMIFKGNPNKYETEIIIPIE